VKHVIVADSHIHPFSQFSIGGTGGQNSRVQKTLTCLREAGTYAYENRIKSIIHLGDIYHVRRSQQYEYISQTHQVFRDFKHLGLESTILFGNHDMITKSGSSTFDSLADLATLYKQPEQFHDRNIWLVPYTHDFAQAVKWLEAIPDGAIVLHHLDVIGADTGLGWVSEMGIGKENFARFKLTLGGHYHKKQALLPNFWYMGCVCPQDFNCPDQPGYFVVLDDESGEVTWHENSAPKFTVFDPSAESDYFRLKNCYVKVVGERSTELEANLREAMAANWFYAPIPRQKLVVKPRLEGVTLTTDSSQVVTLYATQYHGNLPLEEVVQVGLNLLNEIEV
jgi:DNA repair exonuclease SbcCD nuclease subunit